MDLKFQVQAKILKPRSEVFDAIYNPDKLSGYFATGGASGPLEEGATVEWRWHDHPDIVADVVVKRVVKDELIELEWEATEGGYNTQIVMVFEALEPNKTLVKISESGWKESERSLESSYGHCMGWTEMLCSCKAYMEHGIKLREDLY